MAEWLLRTALDLSLLIGLILLLRPIVRRLLGAAAAYLLWLLPLLRVMLVERTQTSVSAFTLPEPLLGAAVSPSYDVVEAIAQPAALPWLSLWLAGALVWTFIRSRSWIRLKLELRARATPIELPAARREDMPSPRRSGRARFHLTDRAHSPFVTGLTRPLVYLPHDFFSAYTPEQQRWVLQHELTHWYRLDIWMRLAWEVLRALFWFNPLVHLAAHVLRADQELACDQQILGGRSNKERYEYGRALLVAAGLEPVHRPSSFLYGWQERIAMIERHEHSRVRTLAGLCLCCALGLVSLTRSPGVAAQIESAPHAEGEQITEERSPATDEWERVQRIIEAAKKRDQLSVTAMERVPSGIAISLQFASATQISSLMRALVDDGVEPKLINLLRRSEAAPFESDLIVSPAAPATQ